MSFDDIKDFIISVGFVILAIAVVIYFMLFLGFVGNNVEVKENCNNLENNGHQVKMETVHLFGLPFLDCYIELDDGKSVPYDRYVGVN